MSLVCADRPEDPDASGWPPRVEENLRFDSVEAQNLLPQRGKAASKTGLSAGTVVAPTGVDLEGGAQSIMQSDAFGRNLLRLSRAGWLIIILAAAALILVIVLMVMMYRLMDNITHGYNLIASHIDSASIDTALDQTFDSFKQMHDTTTSASNAGAQIETATGSVLTAVNETAALVTQMNALAAALVRSPTVTMQLGGPAAGR